MSLLDKIDWENENLDSVFNHLIAEVEDVEPEDITVEYIRKRREESVYPETRHDKGSDYGGYDGEGLIFYTNNDFEKIEKSVNEWIQKEL